MDQLTNYKHKIDFLISNDTPLIQPTQTIIKLKSSKECSGCNKKRWLFNESHNICKHCYKAKKLKLSGNKVIDDFIRYTRTNYTRQKGKMKFVPYDKFKNVEFIAEGGFSKIYKAIWIGVRKNCQNVVLKKLNNSKNITSKELNELKIFYDFSVSGYNLDHVSKYFGVTQDPITEEIMIIIPYYNSGDLIHYITKDFFNISWERKLEYLKNIITGLHSLHASKTVHRDLHSGNIFLKKDDSSVTSVASAIIGDLGLSKSATDLDNDNNENYGIIPYMAPEIFQGQKYTKASDIYSFGMIMWEVMTGRRPFWDRNHDTDLIIEIVDGLRPPIVTNAPEGYIELMKECWHSDPVERPTLETNSYIFGHNTEMCKKLDEMYKNEQKNPTKIVETPDIGPVTINNPGAIYKSRPLSNMIHSAMSLRSSKSNSIDLSYYYQKSNIMADIDKRKIVEDLIAEDNDNGQNNKRRKLLINDDYHSRDFEFDIDVNHQPRNKNYITREFGFDI